ncbi:MAG: hypothetical protein KatS3mg104_2514 [Phycisphaerae bacterium]|jgi:TolA-binding protein|nr:MAG: hypothetical protein KatS3mg104_2514 [Phycisphaerae bacterium]
MLSRSVLAAMTAMGLFVVGCKEETKQEVEQATESAKENAKEAAAQATDTTGDLLKAAGEKMENAGEALKEKAAEMAPDATKAVEELYNKAKSAIESGNLAEAKGLIDQLKTHLDKVPPEWKDKIQALLEEYGKKAASSLPGFSK